MKAKVYVETTIVSYLRSRPSRDLIVAAHQRITQEWWDDHRHDYELFVSQAVIREAEAGHEEASESRLLALQGIPLLQIKEQALTLAEELLGQGAFPSKAAADALHVAVSAVHGMDYLLTWNCAHLANARMRPRIEAVCRASGHQPPVICTPEELMGG
jgi:hypothetical protein